MASIKGIAFKKITHFKGHEGEPLQQADIHLNGKKVGFFSEDSWGGPATVDFDSKEMEEEVEAICKDFFKEFPERRWNYGTEHKAGEPNVDEIFTELIELIDFEKEYKKNLKKGFTIFASYRDSKGFIKMCGFKSLDYGKEYLTKEKAEGTRFFTSLDDFIIK